MSTPLGCKPNSASQTTLFADDRSPREDVAHGKVYMKNQEVDKIGKGEKQMT